MPTIPYQIECTCGRTLSGARSNRAVVVNCPGCSAPFLVFPTTPLVELRQTIQKAFVERTGAAHSKSRVPQLWRKPLVAAGAALVIVTALLVMLLNSSLFRGQRRTSGADDVVREETAQARRDIADGEYHRAAERFRKARVARERQEVDPGSREIRWLTQVEKEANLMGDLLDLSPAEILQKAKGLGEDSWQRVFRSRYRNKALIFDEQVFSVGGGAFRIDYPIVATGLPTRIEIPNSERLRSLNVAWPARLVIGIRLSEAKRDPRGNWILLADPDVVLFTEASMFQHSSVPVDDDLVDMLRWQAGVLGLND